MKNLKLTAMFTVIFGLVSVIIAILFHIGSKDWSTDFWKETIFWIAPCVFSFFVGMDSKIAIFEKYGSSHEKDFNFSSALVYGFIVIISALLRDINRSSESWLKETTIWSIASILGFFIGSFIAIKLSFMFKHKKNNFIEPEDTVNSKDCAPVSIIYAPQSIKDRIKDAEIQDIAFEEVVSGNTTTVSAANSNYPKVESKTKIEIVDRKTEIF